METKDYIRITKTIRTLANKMYTESLIYEEYKLYEAICAICDSLIQQYKQKK